MNDEKIFPPTQKKLSDLRSQGQIAFYNLPPRLFLLGLATLSANILFSRFKRILALTQNFGTFSTDIYSSVMLREYIFLSTSLLIFLVGTYATYSLINTKALILPFTKYPKGVCKKQKVSVLTLCMISILLSPLTYLIIFIGSLKSPNEIPSSLTLLSETILTFFPWFCLSLSIGLSLIKRMSFIIENKMSKAELIQESLEGQMSSANKRMISQNQMD